MPKSKQSTGVNSPSPSVDNHADTQQPFGILAYYQTDYEINRAKDSSERLILPENVSENHPITGYAYSLPDIA
jgi:hypothetical protein